MIRILINEVAFIEFHIRTASDSLEVVEPAVVDTLLAKQESSTVPVSDHLLATGVNRLIDDQFVHAKGVVVPHAARADLGDGSLSHAP